jgi:hypothetical protein
MIIASVLAAITGKAAKMMAGGVLDLIKQYQEGKITEAQMKAEVEKASIEAMLKVEVAYAEAATEQFKAFQESVRASPQVARAFVVVMVTQLFVLLWAQWGAAAFELATGVAWPAPNATVDWSYAILALCLGGGAFIFKPSGGIK